MGPKDILVIIFAGALIGAFGWMVLVVIYTSVTGTEFWAMTPLELLLATMAGAWLLAKEHTRK